MIQISHSKIIFGIILITGGLIYVFHMLRVSKETKKDDYFFISFHIRKYVAIIILIVVGFVLVIKELVKLF